MGPVLRFLCILSALAATGLSRTCRLCVGLDSSSCSGTTMTCPADNACGASRTITSLSGIAVTDIFEITCVPNDRCGTTGSISVPNGKMKMGTSCCYSDNCTPPAPTLPGDNSLQNGVTCSSCTSATPDWCYTGDTMQCEGSEDMCLLQRTNINAPVKKSVAIRGCATKSVCSLGTQSSKLDSLDMKTSFSCSSGTFALRSSPIVSFILGIVIAGSFF